MFEGGGLSQHTIEQANLTAGATASFVLSLRAPVTKIMTPSRTRVRAGALTNFRGTASDPTGIRSVSYTLQDARSGRYLSGRRQAVLLAQARAAASADRTYEKHHVRALGRRCAQAGGQSHIILRVAALDR